MARTPPHLSATNARVAQAQPNHNTMIEQLVCELFTLCDTGGNWAEEMEKSMGLPLPGDYVQTTYSPPPVPPLLAGIYYHPLAQSTSHHRLHSHPLMHGMTLHRLTCPDTPLSTSKPTPQRKLAETEPVM